MKYTVYLSETRHYGYIDVDADTEGQAVEKAQDIACYEDVDVIGHEWKWEIEKITDEED